MTNGWIDIKNTDMMLIMGGNPAENHPCGFKWAIEAKRQRNAKMIVVDPRYTRTAATADMFVQIRAGADIAFLGGVVNYAIENNRIAKEYLVNYTNAAFIIQKGFKLPEDGLYSGFDEKKTYDRSGWTYEEGGDLTGKPVRGRRWSGNVMDQAGSEAGGSQSASGSTGRASRNVAYDTSLQHPRCVYQLLKKHYSRYTPEVVERITGIPKDQFLKAADLFTSIRKDGDTKKVATIIYAVGWTQHSFGTQIIRTAAMLQLMMGNVGRAGGGVNALRGHSNIQGRDRYGRDLRYSAGLSEGAQPRRWIFDAWMKRITPTSVEAKGMGLLELLVEHAEVCGVVLEGHVRPGRDQGQRTGPFDYLPKVDRQYSWTNIWDMTCTKASVKGLLAFGMNAWDWSELRQKHRCA
jgi:formate dehydrogenase major subunit